jgi:hypothetical protein
MVSCSPVVYQEAVGWPKGGRNGYLDKEIQRGVYLIEVQDIGGYQQIIDREGAISIYKSYWHRRAKELCPSGYIGEPSVILPHEARIEAFKCNLRLCQDYPMISGIAKCRAAIET